MATIPTCDSITSHHIICDDDCDGEIFLMLSRLSQKLKISIPNIIKMIHNDNDDDNDDDDNDDDNDDDHKESGGGGGEGCGLPPKYYGLSSHCINHPSIIKKNDKLCIQFNTKNIELLSYIVYGSILYVAGKTDGFLLENTTEKTKELIFTNLKKFE